MTRVRCVVSGKSNILVFLLPKNASSTIRAYLKGGDFDGFEDLYDLLPAKYLQFKKVAFLRDPVERFLSGYHEVYCRHIGQGQYFLRHGIEKQRTLHFLKMADNIDSIYEFLDHIENFGFFDVHIRKQVDFIRDKQVNHYFSTECLQDDMQKLYAIIGSDQSLPPLPKHRQRRQKPNKRNYIYRKFELPKDLIDRIEQIYWEDIELYHKHFGDRKTSSS